MKTKMIHALLAFFLVVLAGVPVLRAEEEFRAVQEQTEEDYSDPSAFEGDTDLPGERAPENMPMDDAPGAAGVGVEV